MEIARTDSLEPAAVPAASRLPMAALWAAAGVGAIGLIALIGWAADIPTLKSIIPGLVTMKVNTAICLMLLAAALSAINRGTRTSSFIVFACTTVCVLIALLTAGEYVFGLNLHLDNLLFQDRAKIFFPGRMAPITIICFVCYAIALVLLELHRATSAAQVLLGALIGVSFVTLGGYLYGAPQMLADAPYPVVAIHTAFGMILLSLGGLCVRPTEGLIRIMMADTTGGWLARRLIPTTLSVPLLVGLCVVSGQRARLYGPAFGAALIVSIDIAAMTAIVWSVASLLNRTDTARQISERAAEQHSQLKDNFLATLSHELRTPLMAILGWAVVLSKKQDLDPDAKEGIEVIERNARAQTQIIEDLLDMSRIISGKMKLDLHRLDWGSVVAEAIQTARPSAEARGVQLRLAIDSPLPSIMADPNRLQQIAWNLLSNAIKFTPRGGVVSASVRRCESHVEFVVKDSGQGIKAEFLPHVFERFRQADSGTTRRFSGLGLGLSIVRQLVELHGGTVIAQSEGEGHGATFTVSLPIPATLRSELTAERPALPAEPNGAAAVAAKNQASTVKGLRVLVVDDEADARSLIRRVLEECEAVVVTASSADEAITQLDSERFDALVCDIGMPDRDGYDLIRAIRRRDARAGGSLPAAALTAFARSEDRMRALDVGFQLHAAKPIEPSQLIATVASLAGRA